MKKQKRTRQEKGITLVALIITIIVLLILAVVAIRAVTGDGIIAHAKNAQTGYEKAQLEEEQRLIEYEYQIASAQGTYTGSYTQYALDKKYPGVKIGDYVNYDEKTFKHTPDTSKGAGTNNVGGSDNKGGTLEAVELTTEDLSWRVLGVNKKGELELISADPTGQTLFLANAEGYLNAEENLNNFCNDLYGQGEYSTGARSLNMGDIDNLTRYDKTKYEGYGNKWTYKYPKAEELDSASGLTENMWYRTDKADGTQVTDWTNITNPSFQTFRLPGKTETAAINSSNPGSKELTYTYYNYNIAKELTTEDGFTTEEASAISDMITKGTTGSPITQWLASRSVFCSPSRAYFYVRYVKINDDDGDMVGEKLFYSTTGGNRYYDHKVRPVVALKYDVKLIPNGEHSWNLTESD